MLLGFDRVYCPFDGSNDSTQEKKPFLSSGCCCPLADVAHAQQCFRVAGASKETVIQQEHWVTKYRTFEYKKLGPYAKPYKIEKVMRFAEDVPHDNIKDQDAKMPAELVDVDPKENELPEFAVNGKKWTWMKVEDQYESKCLEEIQDKPYIREPRDQWEKHKQKYGAASCPRVQYTRICPPGEGLYIKQGIPDGKCLWFHENNTEEMQLKFKPQYPSRCPRGYTFGENDWPGVEAARCQCSNRTIDLGNRNYTICDFDWSNMKRDGVAERKKMRFLQQVPRLNFPFGGRESFPWIILKTIFSLVWDFQGFFWTQKKTTGVNSSDSWFGGSEHSDGQITFKPQIRWPNIPDGESVTSSRHAKCFFFWYWNIYVHIYHKFCDRCE